MRELHLFAGAGGGILGGILLGHTCVCAVEIEPYCRKVLLQRQRDGILPKFPIWDDVRTFDGRPWRGLVDVVCGGFPCQDISSAGNGAGLSGKRSGLWAEFARVIREALPAWVLLENSPLLVSRGLDSILRDLAEMGYDSRWGMFSAAGVGAGHVRERIFVLSHAKGTRPIQIAGTTRQSKSPKPVGDGNGLFDVVSRANRKALTSTDFGNGDDVAGFMGKYFSAVGNGQVPAVVALAWNVLLSD